MYIEEARSYCTGPGLSTSYASGKQKLLLIELMGAAETTKDLWRRNLKVVQIHPEGVELTPLLLSEAESK